MSDYAVQIMPAAREVMRQLPERLRESVDRRILDLRRDPRPADAIELDPIRNIYVVFEGTLMMTYKVMDNEKLVIVFAFD